jgi:nicotinate-nucleotide adenylyltransferase
MNVTLFGTSADPPTIAHAQIISWLTSQSDRVAVWAADNPFKKHGASLGQRSRMLELLIAEIEPSIRDCAQVYPHLSSRRTLETLAAAKQLWQNADFTLVIGSDLITQLPTWYRVNELLTEVKLLIIPRAGHKINDEDMEILKNLGANTTIAQLSTPTVSSTAIRTKAISTGITPAIAEYIQEHQLYQNCRQHPALK